MYKIDRSKKINTNKIPKAVCGYCQPLQMEGAVLRSLQAQLKAAQ